MKNAIGLGAAYVLSGECGVIAKLIDILLETPGKKQIEHRLRAFEDPILALDANMEAVCLVLYQAFKIKTMPIVNYVQLVDEAYQINERQLRLLKAKGHLAFDNAAGCSIPKGIELTAEFTVYVGLKSEDRFDIANAINYIDSQPSNNWIDGQRLAERYTLHIDLVRAIFDMFEQQGFGTKSNGEICRYFNE